MQDLAEALWKRADGLRVKELVAIARALEEGGAVPQPLLSYLGIAFSLQLAIASPEEVTESARASTYYLVTSIQVCRHKSKRLLSTPVFFGCRSLL